MTAIKKPATALPWRAMQPARIQEESSREWSDAIALIGEGV